jgi:ribonucleotide monophosphatase NagD (HAD superfamily)
VKKLIPAPIRAQRPLVVGDQLATDIAGGAAAGMPAALVLTGVTDVLRPASCQAAERSPLPLDASPIASPLGLSIEA